MGLTWYLGHSTLLVLGPSILLDSRQDENFSAHTFQEVPYLISVFLIMPHIRHFQQRFRVPRQNGNSQFLKSSILESEFIVSASFPFNRNLSLSLQIVRQQLTSKGQADFLGEKCARLIPPDHGSQYTNLRIKHFY